MDDEGTEKENGGIIDKLMKVTTLDSDISIMATIFHIIKIENGKV